MIRVLWFLLRDWFSCRFSYFAPKDYAMQPNEVPDLVADHLQSCHAAGPGKMAATGIGSYLDEATALVDKFSPFAIQILGVIPTYGPAAQELARVITDAVDKLDALAKATPAT